MYDNDINQANQKAIEDITLNRMRPNDSPLPTPSSFSSKYATLYQDDAGFTRKENLFSQAGNPPSFTEYYNQHGSPPPGFEIEGRLQLQREKTKSLYQRYLDDQLSYQDFLFQAYGKDLLRHNGHDLTSSLYWYNRKRQGDFTSPLDDPITLDTILSQSEQIAYTHDFIDRLNQPASLLPVLTQVTTEKFKDLFNSDELNTLAEQLGSWEKLNQYYRAGLLDNFDPIIYDQEGKATHYYHTDGLLYTIGQNAYAHYNEDGSLNRVSLTASLAGESFHAYKAGFLGGLAGILEFPANIFHLLSGNASEAHLNRELRRRDGVMKHLFDDRVFALDSGFRNQDGSINSAGIARGVASAAGSISALIATAKIGGAFNKMGSALQGITPTGTVAVSKASAVSGKVLSTAGKLTTSMSRFRNGSFSIASSGSWSANLLLNSAASAAVITSRDILDASLFLKARQPVSNQTDGEIFQAAAKTGLTNFLLSATLRATVDDQGLMQKVAAMLPKHEVPDALVKSLRTTSLGNWMVSHTGATNALNLMFDTVENAATMLAVQNMRRGETDGLHYKNMASLFSSPASIFQMAFSGMVTYNGMRNAGGLNTFGMFDTEQFQARTVRQVQSTFQKMKKDNYGNAKNLEVIAAQERQFQADLQANEKLHVCYRMQNALQNLHDRVAVDDNSFVKTAFKGVLDNATTEQFNQRLYLGVEMYNKTVENSKKVFHEVLTSGESVGFQARLNAMLPNYRRMVGQVDRALLDAGHMIQKGYGDFVLNTAKSFSHIDKEFEALYKDGEKFQVTKYNQVELEKSANTAETEKVQYLIKGLSDKDQAEVNSLLKSGYTADEIADGVVIRLKDAGDGSTSLNSFKAAKSYLDTVSGIGNEKTVIKSLGDNSYFVHIPNAGKFYDSAKGIGEAIKATYLTMYGDGAEVDAAMAFLKDHLGNETLAETLKDLYDKNLLPLAAAIPLARKYKLEKGHQLADIVGILDRLETLKTRLRTDKMTPKLVEELRETLALIAGDGETSARLIREGVLKYDDIAAYAKELEEAQKMGNFPAASVSSLARFVKLSEAATTSEAKTALGIIFSELGLDKYHHTQIEVEAKKFVHNKFFTALQRHKDLKNEPAAQEIIKNSSKDFGPNTAFVTLTSERLERAGFTNLPKGVLSRKNVSVKEFAAQLKDPELARVVRELDTDNKLATLTKNLNTTSYIHNYAEELEFALRAYEDIHYEGTKLVTLPNTITFSFADAESFFEGKIKRKLSNHALAQGKDTYETNLLADSGVSRKQLASAFSQAAKFIQEFGPTLTLNLERPEHKTIANRVLIGLGYQKGLAHLSGGMFEKKGIYYLPNKTARGLGISISKTLPKGNVVTSADYKHKRGQDFNGLFFDAFGHVSYLDDSTQFELFSLMPTAADPDTIQKMPLIGYNRVELADKGKKNTLGGEFLDEALMQGYIADNKPTLHNILVIDRMLSELEMAVAHRTGEDKDLRFAFLDTQRFTKAQTAPYKALGWKFATTGKDQYKVLSFTYSRDAYAKALKKSGLTIYDLVPIAHDSAGPDIPLDYVGSYNTMGRSLSDHGFLGRTILSTLSTGQVDTDTNNSAVETIAGWINKRTTIDVGDYSLELPAKFQGNYADFLDWYAAYKQSAFANAAKALVDIKRTETDTPNHIKHLSVPEVYTIIRDGISSDLDNAAIVGKVKDHYSSIKTDAPAEVIELTRPQGSPSPGTPVGKATVGQSLKSIQAVRQDTAITEDDIQSIRDHLMYRDTLFPEVSSEIPSVYQRGKYNSMLGLAKALQSWQGDEVSIPVEYLYKLDTEDIKYLQTILLEAGASDEQLKALQDKYDLIHTTQTPSSKITTQRGQIFSMGIPSVSSSPEKGVTAGGTRGDAFNNILPLLEARLAAQANSVKKTTFSNADFHDLVGPQYKMGVYKQLIAKDTFNNPGSVGLVNTEDTVEMARFVNNVAATAKGLMDSNTGIKDFNKAVKLALQLYTLSSGTEMQATYDKYVFLDENGDVITRAQYDSREGDENLRHLLLKSLENPDTKNIIILDKNALENSDVPTYKILELTDMRRENLHAVIAEQLIDSHNERFPTSRLSDKEKLIETLAGYESKTDLTQRYRQELKVALGLTEEMTDLLLPTLFDYAVHKKEYSITEQAYLHSLAGKQDYEKELLNPYVERLENILSYGIDAKSAPPAVRMALKQAAFRSRSPVEKYILNEALDNSSFMSYVLRASKDPNTLVKMLEERRTKPDLKFDIETGVDSAGKPITRSISLDELSRGSKITFDFETIEIQYEKADGSIASQQIPTQVAFYGRNALGQETLVKSFFIKHSGYKFDDAFIETSATDSYKRFRAGLQKENRDPVLAYRRGLETSDVIDIKDLGTEFNTNIKGFDFVLSQNGLRFDRGILLDYNIDTTELDSKHVDVLRNILTQFHSVDTSYFESIPYKHSADIYRKALADVPELKPVLDNAHDAQGDVKFTHALLEYAIKEVHDPTMKATEVVDRLSEHLKIDLDKFENGEYKHKKAIDNLSKIRFNLGDHDFIDRFAGSFKTLSNQGMKSAINKISYLFGQKEAAAKSKHINRDLRQKLRYFEPMLNTLAYGEGRKTANKMMDYILHKIDPEGGYNEVSFMRVASYIRNNFGEKFEGVGRKYFTNSQLQNMLTALDTDAGKLEFLQKAFGETTLEDYNNFKPTNQIIDLLKNLEQDEKFMASVHRAMRQDRVSSAYRPFKDINDSLVESSKNLTLPQKNYLLNELTNVMNRVQKIREDGSIHQAPKGDFLYYGSKKESFAKDFLSVNPFGHLTMRGFWGFARVLTPGKSVEIFNPKSVQPLLKGTKAKKLKKTTVNPNSETIYLSREMFKRYFKVAYEDFGDQTPYITVLRQPSDRVSLYSMKVQVLADTEQFGVYLTPQALLSKFNGDVDGDSIALFPTTREQSAYLDKVHAPLNASYRLLDKLLDTKTSARKSKFANQLNTAELMRGSHLLKDFTTDSLLAIARGESNYAAERAKALDILVNAKNPAGKALYSPEFAEELVEQVWLKRETFNQTGHKDRYLITNMAALLPGKDSDALHAVTKKTLGEMLKRSIGSEFIQNWEAVESGLAQKAKITPVQSIQRVGVNQLAHSQIRVNGVAYDKINDVITEHSASVKQNISDAFKEFNLPDADIKALTDYLTPKKLDAAEVLHMLHVLEDYGKAQAIESMRTTPDGSEGVFEKQVNDWLAQARQYEAAEPNYSMRSYDGWDKISQAAIDSIIRSNDVDSRVEIIDPDTDEFLKMFTFDAKVLVVDEGTMPTEQMAVNTHARDYGNIRMVNVTSAPLKLGEEIYYNYNDTIDRGSQVTKDFIADRDYVYLGKSQDNSRVLLGQSSQLDESAKVSHAFSPSFKGSLTTRRDAWDSIQDIQGAKGRVKTDEILFKTSSLTDTAVKNLKKGELKRLGFEVETVNVSFKDGETKPGYILHRMPMTATEQQAFFSTLYKDRNIDGLTIMANAANPMAKTLFGDQFLNTNDKGELQIDMSQANQVGRHMERINTPDFVSNNAVRLMQRLMLVSMADAVDNKATSEKIINIAFNHDLSEEAVWGIIMNLGLKHFPTDADREKLVGTDPIKNKLFSKNLLERMDSSVKTGYDEDAEYITGSKSSLVESSGDVSKESRARMSSGALPLITQWNRLPLTSNYMAMKDFVEFLNPKAKITENFARENSDLLNIGKTSANKAGYNHNYLNDTDWVRRPDIFPADAEADSFKAGFKGGAVGVRHRDHLSYLDVSDKALDDYGLRSSKRGDVLDTRFGNENFALRINNNTKETTTPQKIYRMLAATLPYTNADGTPNNRNSIAANLGLLPKEAEAKLSVLRLGANKDAEKLFELAMEELSTGRVPTGVLMSELAKQASSLSYYDDVESRKKGLDGVAMPERPDHDDFSLQTREMVDTEFKDFASLKQQYQKAMGYDPAKAGDGIERIAAGDKLHHPIETNSLKAFWSTSGFDETGPVNLARARAIRHFGGDIRFIKGELTRQLPVLHSMVQPIRNLFDSYISAWSKVDAYKQATANERKVLLAKWGVDDMSSLESTVNKFESTFEREAGMAKEIVAGMHEASKLYADRVQEPALNIYETVALAIKEKGDNKETFVRVVETLFKDRKTDAALLNNLGEHDFFVSTEKVAERLAKVAAICNMVDRLVENGDMNNAHPKEAASNIIEKALANNKVDKTLLNASLKTIEVALAGKGFNVAYDLPAEKRVVAAYKLLNTLDREITRLNILPDSKLNQPLSKLQTHLKDLDGPDLKKMQDLIEIREARADLAELILAADSNSVKEIIASVKHADHAIVDQFGRKLALEANDTFNVKPLHDMSLEYCKTNLKMGVGGDYEFRLASAILQGDVYYMNKEFADYLDKKIFTAKVPGPVMKKLKEIGQWSTKLIMGSVPKLITRFTGFSSFDLAMGLTVNPKTVYHYPAALRELKAYYQSKGATLKPGTELESFLRQVGMDPAKEKGYDLASMDMKVQAPEVLNKAYFQHIDKFFTFQTLSVRYAMFKAIKESFDKETLLGKTYGNTYGNKEAVDSLKTSDEKAMYIVEQTIGAPGGFPRIAKNMAGFAIFTTFPLALIRWGGETLGTTHRIISKGITEGFTKESLKHLAIPSLGLLGVYAIVQAIISAVGSIYDVDEEQIEEWQKNQVFMDPFTSFIQGRPMPHQGLSSNPIRGLYDIFVEPFRNPNNETLPQKFRGILDSTLLGRANPTFKLPYEVIAGKDIIGSNRIDTRSTYDWEENLVRKITGYAIGIAGSSAMVRDWQYSGVDTENPGFYQRLGSAMGSALAAEIGNTRGYKEERRNYSRALSLVNSQISFERQTGSANRSFDSSGFDMAKYSDLRGKVFRALNDGARPSTIYGLIDEAISEGTSRQEIISAVRSSSISGRLNMLENQEDFVNSLGERELNSLKRALAYEEMTYPVINEILPQAADSRQRGTTSYIPRGSSNLPQHRPRHIYQRPWRFPVEYKQFEYGGRKPNLYVPQLTEHTGRNARTPRANIRLNERGVKRSLTRFVREAPLKVVSGPVPRNNWRK